jgi:uncharacterized DUF497 family protein
LFGAKADSSSLAPQNDRVEEVFERRLFIPLGQQYEPVAPEPRFGVLGEASKQQAAFWAFILRNQAIRVISARPM